MQWISTIEINSLNNVNLTAIWEGTYDFPFFCPLLNLLSLALVADIFCLIFASGVRVMLSLRRGFGGRLVIIELFESEISLVLLATKVADPASAVSVVSEFNVFVRSTICEDSTCEVRFISWASMGSRSRVKSTVFSCKFTSAGGSMCAVSPEQLMALIISCLISAKFCSSFSAIFSRMMLAAAVTAAATQFCISSLVTTCFCIGADFVFFFLRFWVIVDQV